MVVIEGEVFACGGTYGMRLRFENGGTLVYEDVDCEEESVQRLIARLCGEEAEEEQLRYLVQDHLVREYTLEK